MYLRRDRALTAITIMLDVAFNAGRAGVVSGADIAKRGDMLRRGIEPVLQALSREGLLSSVRGPKGGYRLGRPPRTITLHAVVAAVMEDREPDDDGINPLIGKVLTPLWQSLDCDIARRMEALTLESLLKQAEEAGLQRPARTPISFSI